ncbi:catalase-related domain-containing protein [Streptomyces sp. NPDC048417]|uniref:catalase-related domain-containing protein n=1 Tax=Streptomyces sp. NPDC048417 TaxID=3155387 RepID=UPI00344A9A63
MSPIEREHIVAAHTFELGECWETAIKEQALKVLANIDPDLCTHVAAGPGFRSPRRSSRLRWSNRAPPSPNSLRTIWTAYGKCAGTAQSTEFDAILPTGAPAPAADAYEARDAKVDDDAAVATAIAPRLLLTVTEAYRHGKAIGAWGEEAVPWRQPATGIHSQCIGLQAGGDANLMVATRSVADSGPAEPDTAVPRLRRGASRGLVPAEPGGAHTGRFCCSMYCLTTESGAPPTVPAK